MKPLPLLEAVLAAWVAIFVSLGIVVAREVRTLAGLSDTVELAGLTLAETGETLETLAGVPFVGEEVAPVTMRLRATARSAIESGRESRESVEDVSLIAGLAVALAPTLPPLALYAGFRLGLTRPGGRVSRTTA